MVYNMMPNSIHIKSSWKKKSVRDIDSKVIHIAELWSGGAGDCEDVWEVEKPILAWMMWNEPMEARAMCQENGKVLFSELIFWVWRRARSQCDSSREWGLSQRTLALGVLTSQSLAAFWELSMEETSCKGNGALPEGPNQACLAMILEGLLWL